MSDPTDDKSEAPEKHDFIVGPALSQAALRRRQSTSLLGNGTRDRDALQAEREQEVARRVLASIANIAPPKELKEDDDDSEAAQLLDDSSEYSRMTDPNSPYYYCWEAATEDEKQDVEQAREATAAADKIVEDSAHDSETGMPSANAAVHAEEARTDQRLREVAVVEAHGKPSDAALAQHDIQTLEHNADALRHTEQQMAAASTDAERWQIFKKNCPERAAYYEHKYHKHVPTSEIERLTGVSTSEHGNPLPGKTIKADVSPTDHFHEAVATGNGKGTAPALEHDAAPSPLAPQQPLPGTSNGL